MRRRKSDPPAQLAPDYRLQHGHAGIVAEILAAPAFEQAALNRCAADPRGSTPLHLAARRGAAEIVSLLLSASADATIVDADGLRPIEVCARSNSSVLQSFDEFARDVHRIADALLHVHSPHMQRSSGSSGRSVSSPRLDMQADDDH